MSLSPMFDPFRPIWAHLGLNVKFCSRLIQSAYYALTFSEEIRKKYQTVFEWISKRSILGRIGPDFDPFGPLTRERDFSRTCGFRRKLRNIMFFHFKQKSTYQWFRFSSKLQKPYFGPDVTPFCPITGKSDFSRKIGLCQFFTLQTPKLMCDIRKILWSDFEKSSVTTCAAADRHQTDTGRTWWWQ